MENNNIYPIFDRMMTRGDKEALLGQHSLMVWFTGLSGSGKSTIAIALERELHQRGLLCRILDGDHHCRLHQPQQRHPRDGGRYHWQGRFCGSICQHSH